jgi:hypothetical protein
MKRPHHNPITFRKDHIIRHLLSGEKTRSHHMVRSSHALAALARGRAPADVLKPSLDFSPYGYKGDKLWVQEVAWYDHHDPERWSKVICYREQMEDANGLGGIGRPPDARQMPRWASRIWLEIVSVGLKRLHDVGEQEAKEDVVFWANPLDFWTNLQMRSQPDHWRYRAAFRWSWTDRHSRAGLPGGTRAERPNQNSWEKNPWVWSLKFKRV